MNLTGITTISTKVKDAFCISTWRHHDNRGFFTELFNNIYPCCHWQQINHSFSKKDVLRGIHVSPFAKLITCLTGKIFDVVVDLRKDSPTYLYWDSFELVNGKQLFVPENCGHGFLALEDSNVVYLQTGVYDGKDLNFYYKSFGIKWPEADYILSEKDLMSAPA